MFCSEFKIIESVINSQYNNNWIDAPLFPCFAAFFIRFRINGLNLNGVNGTIVFISVRRSQFSLSRTPTHNQLAYFIFVLPYSPLILKSACLTRGVDEFRKQDSVLHKDFNAIRLPHILLYFSFFISRLSEKQEST